MREQCSKSVNRAWPARLMLELLESRNLLAGHTLGTAGAVTLGPLNTAAVNGNLATVNLADLYRVHLDSGDRLSVAVRALTAGSGLQSILRVFSPAGQQLALDNQEGGDSQLTFQAARTDNYFV